MLFRDVVGHDSLKTRLIQSARENRISHAQLFHGPEGCGNFALALAFARYLVCPNRSETDSCGMCPTCKKVTTLQFADLHFSYPYFNRKSGKQSVSTEFLEEWRSMVSEFGYFDFAHWRGQVNAENKQLMIGVKEAEEIVQKIALKSYEGGLKVLIVWLPEYMNISCANKLLKTIEEPPDNTVFLLVSHAPEQIISTILSRTQMTKVPALSDEDIHSALLTRLGVTKADMAEEITTISEGNYFKAYALARLGQENLLSEVFIDWMRNCYTGKAQDLVAFSDVQHTSGRETVKKFLEYALHMVRQCTVLNYAGDAVARLTSEERVFAKKFAPFINERNVMDIVEQLELAHRDVGRNIYTKLVMLDLSMRMHKFLHA